jgi:hypothetical protein
LATAELELCDGARRRLGNEEIEVRGEAEGADDANEIRELGRLSCLEPLERALGHAGFGRKLCLRQVALEARLGEAFAELTEDYGVCVLGRELHLSPNMAIKYRLVKYIVKNDDINRPAL